MTTLRLRWRYFWSRRSRRRTTPALVFSLVGLIAITYLALPSSAQNQVKIGLITAERAASTVGVGSVLAAVAILAVIVSLMLIFIPSYRRHSYLATTPSVIPLISVYIDAENQLPERMIRRFTEVLREHLNGRRADLLYFLDASQPSYREKYKILYRFGFRPVDVPHDPTGKAKVKEAVDKELAMHAYERALLGPANQEFIIVTGDQDFVALVYRLAALGHHVQVWASPIWPAYRELANYLDIDLIDLTHYFAEVESPASEGNGASSVQADRAHPPQAGSEDKTTVDSSRPKPKNSHTAVSPVEISASPVEESGEQQLYRAIVQTLLARASSEERSGKSISRNNAFRGTLGKELSFRLAGVGYAASSKIDYWIEHLTTIGVLKKGSNPFPLLGTTSADAGARALFTVAQLAALSAVQAVQEHPDKNITMSDIAAKLASRQAQVGVEAMNLLKLVAHSNPKRTTHARYFVRSARALGLLDFDDVRNSPDLIAHPRLLAVTATSTEQEEAIVTTESAPSASDPATSGGVPSSTSDLAALVPDVEHGEHATADSPETVAETAVVDAVGVQVGGQRYGDQPNHRGGPDIPA